MTAVQGKNDRATATAGGFWVHAGPWAYKVLITNDEVVDDEGNTAWAYYDAGRFEIVLSADLPRGRRVAKIEHELAHVYESVFGKPRTEEERARRQEVISEQMRRDLRRQGGEETIMALEPVLPD